MTGDAMTITLGKNVSETALNGDRATFIGPLTEYGGLAPAS